MLAAFAGTRTGRQVSTMMLVNLVPRLFRHVPLPMVLYLDPNYLTGLFSHVLCSCCISLYMCISTGSGCRIVGNETNEIPAGGWVVEFARNLQISSKCYLPLFYYVTILPIVVQLSLLSHTQFASSVGRSLLLLRLGLGLLAELGTAAGFGLLLLLLLQELQGIDLVADRVLRADGVGDLLTADQAGDNAGAHHEGQDEPVHAVPVGSPAGRSGTRIIVVEEGEGKELADQGILDGEQQGRPGNGRGHHTSGVAAVAVLAAVSGPFKAPVDGSEEREDLD